MNVRNRLRTLVCVLATLVALVAMRCGLADDTAGDNAAQLRWTPHRIASVPQESARPATPEPAMQAPPAPPLRPTTPTTVTLPREVPRASDPPASAFAPLRQGFPPRFSDWMSGNRLPGSLQTSTPADPDSIFGVTVFRAPQGERGRPILAPEGPQRRSTSQAAVVPPPVMGDAPRFVPQQPSGQTPRERIAMNVDGIPSVMSRGPQSAALDDAAVPGRLPAPPQAPTTQTIPSPATPSGPSMMTGPGTGEAISSMPGMMTEGGFEPGLGMGDMPSAGGMWMGQYPAQVHVESMYDDPYAYEDCEDYCGLPICAHDGRICAWLRRFGRPYYGWRWYRDFTASAGVTSFTNATDLGLNGNFGVNEYLNWTMPFWNAFGIGWQVGVRGVQADFQPVTVTAGGTSFSKNTRDQVFVTTGFFTRAFEGRGLQGGAAYDYLRDNWFDTVDVAQIRSELSYVWGYHEIGYWGAQNVTQQASSLLPSNPNAINGTTVSFYSAFYRLHFGDANEWRAWGGATANGEGIFGSSLRAPMTRSFALEGTFTYLVPKQSQTVSLGTPGSLSTYSPAAWNISVNLVFYPAGRSRRSLASPYRPLFDVADNGSMIRTFTAP